MDNQVGKRIEVIRRIVEHTKRWNEMHPELSGDPTLLMSDVELMVEEMERLQQKLSDYEGCKGVEEYYAAVSKNRELKAEAEQWRRQYEALVQSIKDGLAEWPPAKSAEDLVCWIESTCPFIGDLREGQSLPKEYRIFKVNDDYIAAETMEQAVTLHLYTVGPDWYTPGEEPEVEEIHADRKGNFEREDGRGHDGMTFGEWLAGFEYTEPLILCWNE